MQTTVAKRLQDVCKRLQITVAKSLQVTANHCCKKFARSLQVTANHCCKLLGAGRWTWELGGRTWELGAGPGSWHQERSQEIPTFGFSEAVGDPKEIPTAQCGRLSTLIRVQRGLDTLLPRVVQGRVGAHDNEVPRQRRDEPACRERVGLHRRCSDGPRLLGEGMVIGL